MNTNRSRATYLLYGAAGVLILFALFLGVNFILLGRLPGLMEDIVGLTTGDIAAFHQPLLSMYLAGFRMVAVILLAYSVGIILLARDYGRGQRESGQIAFAMQAILIPLAIIMATVASVRTPWPVFLVSGLLTVGAYAYSRRTDAA